MQRLQIQLIIGLYRNAACRWALYSFCDRVRIPEVVLVTLTERCGIGRRHLFDLVTERQQRPKHLFGRNRKRTCREALRRIHATRMDPTRTSAGVHPREGAAWTDTL